MIVDPAFLDSEPDPQRVAEVRAAEERSEARAEDARRQHDWALERASKRRWYGRETLGVDAASAGLLALTVPALIVPPVAALTFLGSFGTYVVGAPVVHLAHGRPNAAALSLGMRLLGPPVGAAVSLAGAAVVIRAVNGPPPPRDPYGNDPDRGSNQSWLVVAAAGAALSIPVVISLDASLLAWDPPPVFPLVEATPGGGVVKLGGAF